MPQARLPLLVSIPVALALVLSACGSSSSSTSSSTAAASASATAAACAKGSLVLHTPGKLTLATDSPAYSPYFLHNNPSNGEGFESAVAYAIASKLGFTPKEVTWTVEPFDSSYAPGPKSFDFDINEISITPARAKEVSFSVPYFNNPQGVIVQAGSKYATAKSLSELQSAKIGVQIGSTSLTAVERQIKPTTQPQVFNNSNDVVSAFKNKTVDAIVVDLATAFELTGETLSAGKLVGQFSAPGGDSWGVLMAKGSSLQPCVNAALTAIRANGTLRHLETQWMQSSAGVPELH